jgi:hypothetical protein
VPPSTLERVIEYLYREIEPASQAEHELKTIMLRMLSLLKSDRFVAQLNGRHPLDFAMAYASLGKSFADWRSKTLLRLSRAEWELSRCVPDYDPEEARIRGAARRERSARQG